MTGNVLNEKYLVLNTIDEGGMAVIYRAVCLDTGYFVAVKALKPEYAEKKEYITNFKKETQSMFDMQHPNIVQAIDRGEFDGRQFFVMEYIPGSTLKRKIDKEGAQSVRKCVDISLKICEALKYAHSKGIIHRDLKPQNILMKENGEPILTDFGIAHDISANEKNDDDGMVMGSVNYFSPEQAKGGKMDQRSDLYSLGVMIYEMATGSLPFKGEDALSVALKHVHQKPAEPKSINPEIPESLNRIIMKAMCKNPKNRYQSADEMISDLKKCLVNKDGEYITVPDEDGEQKPKRKHKKALVAVVSAVLLAAVVLVVLFIYQSSRVLYVPSLSSGTTEAEITEKLQSFGVKVEVEYQYSDSIAPGTVVNISPAAGSAVERGDTVKITVIDGDQSNKMLYIKGKTFTEALDIIKDLKWKSVSISYVSNSSYRDGEIISQSPEYGTVMTDSATISITVNRIKNTETAVVPLIIGLSISNAEKLVQGNGMGKLFVYFEQREGAEAGIIIEQQPKDGNVEMKGTNMTAWVQSLGTENYSGVYMPDESVLEDGMNLRITTVMDGTPSAEAILIETQIPSKAAFMEQYKDGITINMYLNSDEQEKSLYIMLYKNDQEIMCQRATLYKK